MYKPLNMCIKMSDVSGWDSDLFILFLSLYLHWTAWSVAYNALSPPPPESTEWAFNHCKILIVWLAKYQNIVLGNLFLFNLVIYDRT